MYPAKYVGHRESLPGEIEALAQDIIELQTAFCNWTFSE